MSTASDLDFGRLLDGQVALITGAASGQGRAAARLFGLGFRHSRDDFPLGWQLAAVAHTAEAELG